MTIAGGGCLKPDQPQSGWYWTQTGVRDAKLIRQKPIALAETLEALKCLFLVDARAGGPSSPRSLRRPSCRAPTRPLKGLMQAVLEVLEMGLALIVGNDGGILRRGFGRPNWKVRMSSERLCVGRWSSQRRML